MPALTYFEYKNLEALEPELSALIERTPRPRSGKPETIGDALDHIRWNMEGVGSLVRGRFPTSLDAYLTVVGERVARYARRLGAFPTVPDLQREAAVILSLDLRCSPESDLACARGSWLRATPSRGLSRGSTRFDSRSRQFRSLRQQCRSKRLWPNQRKPSRQANAAVSSLSTSRSLGAPRKSPNAGS